MEGSHKLLSRASYLRLLIFDVYREVSRQMREIFYAYARLAEPLSLMRRISI
jgi:hypothetical protein